MIVLDVVCRARDHDSPSARRRGCVCPEGWGRAFRRPQRTYVQGRVINLFGPRRKTVKEPDEAAVVRTVGGDWSLRLAAVERDAAIDWLDRYDLSAEQIARRLGITMRTVQRRRAARRSVAS